MFDLFKKNVIEDSRQKAAHILGTSREALAIFENKYKEASMSYNEWGAFGPSSKDVVASMKNDNINNKIIDSDTLNDLKNRIVDELIDENIFSTSVKNNATTQNVNFNKTERIGEVVSKTELLSIPLDIRPQLTGTLMISDCPGSGEAVLMMYDQYLKEKAPIKKQIVYGMFRQGLDMLDLDGITYEMLSLNKSSAGYWFPILSEAAKDTDLKVPQTTIAKVPLPLLQLSRLDYMSLNRTTLDIVNEWAKRTFKIEEGKEYFIKNGVYSSKFDFRNARISGDEVKDIGEYLLFIQNQASTMAHYDLSGKGTSVIYGPATTNEWVVREFIPPKEDTFEIYHGLPLRTEYRAFVDFSTGEVFGVNPYWDENVVLPRFEKAADSKHPDMIHDSVTFRASLPKLKEEFAQNKDIVLENVKALVDSASKNGITGQWSIDIMQNGDDFYLIDAALAEYSMYYDKVVPIDKRCPQEEIWIPIIDGLDQEKDIFELEENGGFTI